MNSSMPSLAVCGCCRAGTLPDQWAGRGVKEAVWRLPPEERLLLQPVDEPGVIEILRVLDVRVDPKDTYHPQLVVHIEVQASRPRSATKGRHLEACVAEDASVNRVPTRIRLGHEPGWRLGVVCCKRVEVDCRYEAAEKGIEFLRRTGVLAVMPLSSSFRGPWRTRQRG